MVLSLLLIIGTRCIKVLSISLLTSLSAHDLYVFDQLFIK